MTTNWKGDVLIIAGGVFVGQMAWALISGFLKWFLPDPVAPRDEAIEHRLDDVVAAIDGLAEQKAD